MVMWYGDIGYYVWELFFLFVKWVSLELDFSFYDRNSIRIVFCYSVV